VDEFFQVQLPRNTSLLVPLANTIEILACYRQEICPIPGVALNLLGVVNRRGKLLWILALSELLGLTHKANRFDLPEKLFVLTLTAESKRINSELDEQQSQVGCVVEKLQGIVSVEPSLVPVNDRFDERAKPFLLGMTKLENSQVAILDVQKLLIALRNF
jgi:chemotaxis signal transduction protein